MVRQRVTGESRRKFLSRAAAGAIAGIARAESRPPNIVLIYADDLGYGDLSCYGSGIRTPNLDRMAEEGIRLTDFYSASPVCSPARAALLTGRYPSRVGVPRVLGPDEPAGLPDSETTIAKMLKGVGYATACIGKWHLGSRPGFLPMDRGFDEHFGTPYSNDMVPCPLVENGQVLEPSVNLANLTRRYTQRAVSFISRSKDRPFFLYIPHTFPHIPLAASPEFQGRSGHGAYGDAIQELDWSVGQVIQALKDAGVDGNTLVMFSSDNGPWYQGSAANLRGRKGSTYEGGMRVPFLARFPGRIPAGQVSAHMATALDILPTAARLAGTSLPPLPVDGIDIWPILRGDDAPPNRDVFVYFNDIFPQCARMGPWKLHFSRFDVPMFNPVPERGRRNLPLPRAELYNVVEDPSEAHDRAERNQAVAAEIRAAADRVIATFPEGVLSAWRTTLSRQVEATPSGALPVERVVP